MKLDWQEMRERIRHENREIEKRRQERLEKLIEDRGGAEKTVFSRALRRMGGGGQPASRIYAEKMAIPKERK